MSLIERFLGKPDADRPLTELAANPAIENPLHVAVLFSKSFDFDGEAIAQALRSLDPKLEKARVETVRLDDDRMPDDAGNMIGLAGWGPHVLKLIYYEAPVPDNIFEACVRFAQFDPQLKDDAAGHRAHALIYYSGDEIDPLEQYVALTTLATAFARLGAILVINEAGRSAFPAEALLPAAGDGDLLESLRTLPIPLFYGGFVKVEIEGQKGVWMRTFGNHLLGLPNLATHAPGHQLGNECFDLFTNILMYARAENVEFLAGQSVQLGPNLGYAFRERTDAEWWLESQGTMLVLDRIE